MTGKTLLIGNGPCARRIAEDLVARNRGILVATPEQGFDISPALAAKYTAETSMEILTETKVISCRGSAGNFSVALKHNGKTRKAAVGNIVIAEEERRIPCFSLYGLTPASTIISLSDLKPLVPEPPGNHRRFAGITSMVFLSGIVEESNPVVMEEIMAACLKLQTSEKLKTYILTRNLKVAADGLENMYRKTKTAGVVYIKFTDAQPEIVQMEDGRVRFEFVDEITGDFLRLSADLTIVDEKIAPSNYATELSRIFELDGDPNGFAQRDNVHRLTVCSNRRGILVAGPARCVQSISDQYIDAGNAVLSLLEQERPASDQGVEKARIETGKCVRCLTCYRLCPYRAILVNTRVAVAPDACERCGICVAECPRGAIGMGQQESSKPLVLPAITGAKAVKDDRLPSITAYCCSRSAARAAELAARLGYSLPPGLQVVEVPCGGSVSLGHILAALNGNADGVMVLTCHEGNCHSEFGNIYARQRVDRAKALCAAIGMESGRLVHRTLASNMGIEFAQAVAEFEKQLLEMEPGRLKTGKK